MGFSRKIGLLGVFCLFLFSYFPNLSFAEITAQTNNPVKYVEIMKEAEVYNSNQQVVGEIKEGTEISIDHIQDGKVYFQWDGDIAYLLEENIQDVADSNVSFTPVDYVPGVKIITKADTEVFSEVDLTTVLFTIAPNVTYSATKKDDEHLTIIVGNHVGVIESAAVEFLNSSMDPQKDALNQNSTEAETSVTNTKSTVVTSVAKTESTTATSAAKTESTPATTATKTESTPAGPAKTVSTPTPSPQFLSTDRYFKVVEQKITVYDNSGGTLKPVGYLAEGQVYPRTADYGEWHQIKYGNGYGYVWKASTIPADSSTIKNANTGLKNSNRSYIPLEELTVYDNSSGKLVPFAFMHKGSQYPFISEMGDWYKIDIAGRIGYVYKPGTKLVFMSSDKYFQVKEDYASVYDNSTGSLVHVGYLLKGQTYPRVSDYGDWHQIKYGNGYGYVWKDATSPVLTQNLKNINTGQKNTSNMFIATDTLSVYDNSSGGLVPFAKIFKGVKYPIISEMGDWYKIDISGRIGYVYKPATQLEFKSTDNYFQVTEDRVTVYENKNGSLVNVGYLLKNQIYPRVSDYGDWHQIKYGRGYGYIWKAATKPASGTAIKNLSTITTQGDQNFNAVTDLSVYDNTSGSLVPYGVLKSGTLYPTLGMNGDWIKVDFAGRIGYVYKAAVEIGPQYTNSQYNETLQEALNIQVSLQNPAPQTDKKYRTFVRQDAFIVDNLDNPTSGVVNGSSWIVRGGPDSTYWIVGTLNSQEQVSILSKVWNTQDNMYWYEIKYNRTWVNASPEDVLYYLNPASVARGSKEEFQFLKLSGSAGADVDELNANVLLNKGILTNKAQVFYDASVKNNINEVYLISHALLETDNGTSPLANGILVTSVYDNVSKTYKPVEPKTVYNMYGISANDSCPNTCGAEYAYLQGWFTPEAAIEGGAQWIANKYINNAQDTLYKMRWNPLNPGTYQYASDIGWALKQTTNIKKIYDLIDSYILRFDYPVYK